VNTKRVKAAGEVILAAQKSGHITASGWAAALESACLLQSPETAAEQQALQARLDTVERAYVFDVAELRRENDALRAQVAALLEERHVTNEALSDAAEQLRADRDRIAELEALTPAPIQTCRVCGAGYSYGEPCSTCEFRARMAAETDGITRRIAPTQALREDEPQLRGRALLDALTVERAERAHKQRLGIEDPHDSPLHHDYRIGRDLPEPNGAS
jgi:DNA repair exonuclease SbcCD ATPase subunit